MIPVIYGELCPQCHKELRWEEIEDNVCKNTGKELSHTRDFEIYEEFERFFVEKFKSKPRAIQRMWARRVLFGQSFAAIAPTGIGKSSFGIIMSMFLASKGKKSYLLVPTTIILKEMVKKLEELGAESVVFYHSKMKKDEKEAMENRIKDGDFKILITTTAYLSRNYRNLYGKFFNFIFVDDVDSLLKRSKNLEKVLGVLHKKGVLMVSTATGTKGYNTRILREKLGFDVGNMRNAVRNIEDIYAPKDSLMDILSTMGSGALIFAPTAEEAKEIAEFIGNNAGIVVEENKKAYEDFQAEKLDYLVGVATPSGSLIRGIDMPERIRYVVFYGIPKFKINAENLDNFGDKLIMALAYGLRDYGFENYIKKGDIEAIRGKLKEMLKEGREIRGDGFVYRDGYIIFPDIKTYIQGSGRASRLYAGGITKGASFVLDTDDMIDIFVQRANIYGIEFKPLEDVNIEDLKREIDEDRRKIKGKVEERDVIAPALFIVESPNKAKHIAHFFGKPNIRIIGNTVVYEVAIGDRILTIAPSLGHTVDLSTTKGYHGVLKDHIFIPFYSPIRKCRDCGYQFTEGDKCPICGSKNIYNAKNQIEVLRKLAYECEDVIVGTDPDTEGEKIAWDLKNLLLPFAKSIERAEFHEVTKNAITKAIRESRGFNENLVKAQIVRRIEDRWIGFELSHILWNIFGKKNLSAGRAQTPVLGWIIDRYEKSKEIREEYFIKGTDVKSPWKESVIANVVRIGDDVKDYAVPPYTTDEILKDANSILGLGARETMDILQNLFESGLITYHRTDSTHVSEEGMHIAKKYLSEDFKPRSWGKEGAHECIRPTKPWSAEDLIRFVNEGILNLELQDKALRVYDLIFRRFMASQSTGKIRISKYKVSARGKILEIPLIVQAYGKSVELYPYRIKLYRPLPTGKVRIEIEKRKIKIAPYTQADLIRLMKDRRIGRPSTYATIISKIFKRSYIVERKGKLIPTNMGIKVYSFLFSNYGSFVSEERTRILERKMDEIENGLKDYQEVLSELYEEMAALRGN